MSDKMQKSDQPDDKSRSKKLSEEELKTLSGGGKITIPPGSTVIVGPDIPK